MREILYVLQDKNDLGIWKDISEGVEEDQLDNLKTVMAMFRNAKPKRPIRIIKRTIFEKVIEEDERS